MHACVDATIYRHARGTNQEVGHYHTSFNVVSVFAVAVLVEAPIMVDKVAWELGALVGPAGD